MNNANIYLYNKYMRLICSFYIKLDYKLTITHWFETTIHLAGSSVILNQ